MTDTLRHAAHAYGVAIGADDVVVVAPDGLGVWRGPLVGGRGQRWPALRDAVTAALQQLAGRTSRGETTRGEMPRGETTRAPAARSPRAAGSRPVVRVALLPPLAEVRVVSLPPVNDLDARRVLVQAASRHFLAAAEPLAIGVAPATALSQAGALPTRIAGAVPAALLTAIYAAVTDAGCHLDLVVPALAAWSCHVPPGTRGVLVATNDALELAAVHGGAPVSLRRFRTTGDEAALALAQAELGTHHGAVQTITDPPLAAAQRLAVLEDTAPLPLRLEPDDAARVSSRPTPGVPRAGLWVAGALFVALAAVGVLEWQTRRALAQVRAERAALAPALASAAPLQALQAQARLLAGGEELPNEAPRTLVRTVLALSAALPDDAWVTRLRTRGDSLWVEGRAAHAANAFTALATWPALGAVTASAPIRRETTVQGEQVDRFELVVSPPSRPGAAAERTP